MKMASRIRKPVKGAKKYASIVTMACLAMASTLQNASAEEVVDVFGNGQLPPMTWMDKGGNPRGFGYDLTKKVFENAGIKARVHMVPWARAYKMALEGKGVIFGIFKNPEREKLFHFTKNEMAVGEIIIARLKKETTGPFTLEQIEGMHIGVQRGAFNGPQFARLETAGKVFPVPDNGPDARLKNLLSGKIDAALFFPGISALEWYAMRRDDGETIMPRIETTTEPLMRIKKYFAVRQSAGSKALMGRIDAALANMRKEGQYQQIVSQYIRRDAL